MLHALPPTSGAPSLSSSLYPTAFPNAPSHSAAAQASLFSPPPYAALGRLFPPTFTPAMTQPFPPRPFARPSLDALPTPPSSPSFPPLELQRRQKRPPLPPQLQDGDPAAFPFPLPSLAHTPSPRKRLRRSSSPSPPGPPPPSPLLSPLSSLILPSPLLLSFAAADEALPPLIAAAVGGVAQGEDDNMVQDDVFAWPSAEDLGIELDPEEEMVLPERERKGKSTE